MSRLSVSSVLKASILNVISLRISPCAITCFEKTVRFVERTSKSSFILGVVTNSSLFFRTFLKDDSNSVNLTLINEYLSSKVCLISSNKSFVLSSLGSKLFANSSNFTPKLFKTRLVSPILSAFWVFIASMPSANALKLLLISSKLNPSAIIRFSSSSFIQS